MTAAPRSTTPRSSGPRSARTAANTSRAPARTHRSTRAAATKPPVHAEPEQVIAAVETAEVEATPVDATTTDAPPTDTAPIDTAPIDTAPIDTAPIEAKALESAAADLDEVAASADLVRVYLNEIGKVALLTAADEVELAKRIEAGLYAEHLLSVSQRLQRRAQARAARPGHRRRARQGPPAARQPAAGGVAGQALHRPRHAVPGPDPGGQPGPDPRGREVRLHQGLQVLDLRHLVDPAGDQPRDGRPVAHDPAARPPGRAGQQAAADAPRAEPGAGPRGHRRRARAASWTSPRTGCAS